MTRLYEDMDAQEQRYHGKLAKIGDELETNSLGLNMSYQKIAETLPQIAKTDFVRICKCSLSENQFKFTKLKRIP